VGEYLFQNRARAIGLSYQIDNLDTGGKQSLNVIISDSKTIIEIGSDDASAITLNYFILADRIGYVYDSYIYSHEDVDWSEDNLAKKDWCSQ